MVVLVKLIFRNSLYNSVFIGFKFSFKDVVAFFANVDTQVLYKIYAGYTTNAKH